jgi:hypothetical protein
LRRRLLLLVAAALILGIVLLYPSLGCRVSRDQISVSPIKPFAVSAPQGYAIGFSFNLTNLGSCGLTAESIRVDLRTATYPDGTVTAMNTTDTQQLHTDLPSGQTKTFSFSFSSYFDYRPAKLALSVEISFGDAGQVTVFQGELEIPQQ